MHASRLGWRGSMSLIWIACIAGAPMPPPTSTPSPTPARVLSRCFHAMGGPSAIETVRSMGIHAAVSLEGDETPLAQLEMFYDRSGRSLVRFSFSETNVAGTTTTVTTSFGSNGEIAWEEAHPSEGGGWRLLEPEDLADRVAANNWLGRLLQLGKSIDADVPPMLTEFHGTRCWQLSIKTTDAEAMHAFFDQQTRLLRGFRRTFAAEPLEDGVLLDPQVLDIVFSEWHPVGDLVLFHHVKLDQGGTRMNIVYESLTINDVPPGMFTLPPQVKALLPSKPPQPDHESTNDE